MVYIQHDRFLFTANLYMMVKIYYLVYVYRQKEKLLTIFTYLISEMMYLNMKSSVVHPTLCSCKIMFF